MGDELNTQFAKMAAMEKLQRSYDKLLRIKYEQDMPRSATCTPAVLNLPIPMPDLERISDDTMCSSFDQSPSTGEGDVCSDLVRHAAGFKDNLDVSMARKMRRVPIQKKSAFSFGLCKLRTVLN